MLKKKSFHAVYSHKDHVFFSSSPCILQTMRIESLFPLRNVFLWIDLTFDLESLPLVNDIDAVVCLRVELRQRWNQFSPNCLNWNESNGEITSISYHSILPNEIDIDLQIDTEKAEIFWIQKPICSAFHKQVTNTIQITRNPIIFFAIRFEVKPFSEAISVKFNWRGKFRKFNKLMCVCVCDCMKR